MGAVWQREIVDHFDFSADKPGMMVRYYVTALVAMLAATASMAAGQQLSTADEGSTVADVQASHIAANAPPEASFMTLLERDIAAYLVAEQMPTKSLEITLLRKGATQSGVAYPKYYAWIRTDDGARHHIAGAMRVAAIDRTSFDVTDFTPVATIRSDPAVLNAIYPAALIPAVLQQAARDEEDLPHAH